MKTIIALTIWTLLPFGLHSQDIGQKVTDFWWTVNDACFQGVNITKKNGMFMSTSNKVPTGSVYKLKKNLKRNFIKSYLIFNHTTLKSKLAGFPNIGNVPGATPSCNFSLSTTKAEEIEIYAKLIDNSTIGRISAEFERELKKAVSFAPSLTSWGADQIEIGVLEDYLQKEIDKPNPHSYITKITDGKHYVVSTGIWIEGVEFKYDYDKETVDKIVAIYESKKKDFINAGIKFSRSADRVFTMSLKYKEKFYPFFGFYKIKIEKTQLLSEGAGFIYTVKLEKANLDEL